MTKNTKQFNIPEKILIVLQQLESAGHEAFLVGGSVRDLIMGKEPKDWDITTSAKPEDILKVFPDGKYENDFGTVILPEKYIAPTNSQINYKSTNAKDEEQTKRLKS
jgi:tRNA nucleotidyltransferase/poly(A) polymerase